MHISKYFCIFAADLQRIAMITELLTPNQVQLALAERVKKRRLALSLTQAELAKKADIPLSTYRLFEQQGQISLSALIQVAFALNAMQEINTLFASQTWATMDDMLNAAKPKKRIRHE